MKEGLTVDRREALIKLVAGGVVTVGAVSIISSPAFGATLPVAPTPGVQINAGQTQATFSYTLNNPQCTGGSDPAPLVETVSESLTANSGTVVGLVLTASTNGSGKFKQGDTATLTVRTRSRCTYSNATEEPVEQTFVIIFDWVPSAGTFVRQP